MLIATLLIFPSATTNAQTDVLKSAIQNATESVNKAKEADDPLAHKQALQKVIDTSIIRTNEFIGRLSLLRNLEPEYLEQRDLYLATLQGFIGHYHDVLDKLQGLEDVESIKALAAELKGWRDSILNPEIDKVVEFLLVFQGRGILNTANNRYDLITEDVNYFLDNNKDIRSKRTQSLINEAGDLLQAAGGFQVLAEELLLNSTAPQRIGALSSPTVRTLISSSLLKIKSAYKNFLEISALLRAATAK